METKISKVLKRLETSSIKDKIQNLFNRFADGAIVDFDNEVKIGKSEYSYPVLFKSPVDFSELQNIFKKYGTSDNIYIAELISNDTGNYLHVHFNKQDKRNLEFKEALDLLKKGVDVDRYNNSNAIVISPEVLEDLHLYVFVNDNKYTMDLINHFNGKENYMLSDLESYLNKDNLENLTLDEVDKVLSSLGIEKADIIKVHNIAEEIKEE